MDTVTWGASVIVLRRRGSDARACNNGAVAFPQPTSRSPDTPRTWVIRAACTRGVVCNSTWHCGSPPAHSLRMRSTDAPSRSRFEPRSCPPPLRGALRSTRSAVTTSAHSPRSVCARADGRCAHCPSSAAHPPPPVPDTAATAVSTPPPPPRRSRQAVPASAQPLAQGRVSSSSVPPRRAAG